MAIALSGGVDSCSILAAMLSVGVKPIVVSYTPETHESTDFKMAKSIARKNNLKWAPAIVEVNPQALEQYARTVIGLGYHEKVQVECLSPLLRISEVAKLRGATMLFTGDQADGYFVLSKWASHNLDRAAGVPRGQRTNVQKDTTPLRIDALRRRYWELDKSCSRGVIAIGSSAELSVCVPYRDEEILNSFWGSLWSEVNLPRAKEPIRLAFEKELEHIPTRKLPVNLHKGDSHFAETMGYALMDQPHLQGKWSSPRGLYAAIARGEI